MDVTLKLECHEPPLLTVELFSVVIKGNDEVLKTAFEIPKAGPNRLESDQAQIEYRRFLLKDERFERFSGPAVWGNTNISTIIPVTILSKLWVTLGG